MKLSKHRGVSIVYYGGHMRRIRILFGIVAIAFSLVSCGKDETTIDFGSEEEVVAYENIEDEETIFVYVCGAVLNEGVYELPIGSRIFTAIEKAGGFLATAATTEINQAEILEDAMKLYVPTIAEVEAMQSNGDGKVNLNRATKEELMTLPGIGEAKAELIIHYRENVGTFKRIEDVMEIEGIKEGLYEKIKALIQV